MKTQLQKDFSRFLSTGGYCNPPGRAVCALRSARTLAEWRDLESSGCVRICATEEEENYFDVYGRPDDKRQEKQILDTIERWGNWHVFTQVNFGNEAIGDDWQTVDSIGMCSGYKNPCDPFENDYVIDLMRAAVTAVPQPGNVDELCSSL